MRGLLSKTLAIAAIVIAAAIALWPQSSSFEQAIDLFHQRQWADAAAAFDQVEKNEPGKTDALLYRGKALVNLAEFADADAALDQYIRRHPASDDALYLLGYVRFREDRPKESLQIFTDAAKLKPPTADDLKIVALDYVVLKDYESAGKYLEESLKLDPENVEARYHLGRVRYQQNRFDQAIAAFQGVLGRQPENIKAEDNLGLSLEGKNDLAGAIAAYQRAIKLDRASLPRNEQPYLDLGMLLMKSARNEEALPVLEEGAQIAPQSAKTHGELGKCYFALGRLEDARREVEKAAELSPDESSVHYLLGRIYHRLGKSDLAAQQFQQTEELMRAQRSTSSGMGDPSMERK